MAVLSQSVQGVLRIATEADLEVMYRLDVLCFQPPFRFTRGMMRQFCMAQDAFTLILESDGPAPGVLGFVTVQMGTAGGYVVTLDVAPHVRRQGIAGRLLAEAETKASQLGAAEMGLHVWTENTEAIHFYERAGYTPTQLHPGFYDAGLDAYGYSKRLETRLGQREALSQRA